MNKFRIGSIILTVLFCLAILPGAIMDIIQPDMVVEVMEGLGLPLHLLTLIGVWKLLGVIGIAQPKSDRIREWAVAGFFFDLTGAAFLHGAVGDTAGIAPPLVLLGLLGAAQALRGMAARRGAPSADGLAAA
jgi:hypothetical protein